MKHVYRRFRRRWSRHASQAIARKRPERRSLVGLESLEPRMLLASDWGVAGPILPLDPVDHGSTVLLPTAEGEAAAVAEGESAEIHTLADFAQALTDAGVRFFGQLTCTHCQHQKDLFGDAQDQLPYIETTAEVAQQNNITSVPTWEFQDGTRVTGFQPLGALSQLSGIPLPPNFVSITTNVGVIDLQLLPDEAPQTVANFLRYLNRDPDDTFDNNSSYIGTIFHRAADSDAGGEFVLQGGGFKPASLTTTNIDDISTHHIATFDPIPDERGAESRSNTFGTVAMAKNALGATSEFFINMNDNSFLDAQGFTVFALAVGLANPDGTANTDATANRIALLEDVDIDPSPTGIVFDNVPYTAEGELVVIQGVDGSGTVSGVKFEDLDGDGVQDAGELGLQGFTIFSDTDNDGTLDPGELSTVTAADGSYTLVLPAGSHNIREEAQGDFVQTTPADAHVVDVQIGDELTGFDFGNVQVVAPTGIDLLAASDSGSSNSDDVTNFNNASGASAPQFLVTGVQPGATVIVFADGIQIGQATAGTSDTEVTVVGDGVTFLSEGTHAITAAQQVNGVQGPSTADLNITVDTFVPAFTSAPPSQATVGIELTYDAANPEEGAAGSVYSLENEPTGVAIDPSSGVVTWTPAADQVGAASFDVVLTDLAGNRGVQTVSLDVSHEILVRAHFVVTDASGNPISQASVGDNIRLQVFVEDVRPDPKGVFSFYQDITFEENLVTPTGITHDDAFGNAPSGTITTPGLIDEVGSFGDSLSPIGGGQFLLFTVDFTADHSGTVHFTGDAPDNLPFHEIGLYQGPGPIPAENIDFGNASLVIDPAFSTNEDVFNFDEDSADNVMDVLQNDVPDPGVELTIAAVSDTLRGATVTISQDQKQLTYTPPADFFGEDTFTYDVTDGNDTLTETVTVQVFPVNDPPEAVDDTFDVQEDAIDNLLDVLSNDLIFPDANENLTVSDVGASANGGTVERGASGLHVLYTPPANFHGTDTFTYTISDGNGGTSQATVTVNISPTNDDPTAVPDQFTVIEDSTDNAFDVLQNDSALPDEGETLTITEVGTPNRGGTVTIDNGQLLYSPAADVFGEESFTYTISDGNGGTATANVIVTITGTNDPPTANDDELTVTQNTQDNVLDVLANDSILPDEGETLTVTDVSTASQGGTVTLVDGQVIYTPPADFLGDDTFTYTISDGNGETSQATATVHVVEFVPGSISGFVYRDSNNDGVFDSGEEPMAGVTITLSGTDDFGGQVNRETVTDDNGFYEFVDLPPGTYTVNETQPTGQIDGLPILDGQDTIGSQGGSVSANDEFTIVLAEGVHGTDNNFAELLGRRLSGTTITRGPGSQSIAVAGVDLELMPIDESGQPANGVVQGSKSNDSGDYEFPGLPPSQYAVKPAAEPFLLPQTELVFVDVTGGDAEDVEVPIRGIRAEFINYRFFMNITPTSNFLVAAASNDVPDSWHAADTSWQNVSQVQVKYDAQAGQVEIEAQDSQGNPVVAQLPATHPNVEVLGEDAGRHLIRLNSPADVLPWQTAAPLAGDDQGEGEAPAASTVVLAGLNTSPETIPSAPAIEDVDTPTTSTPQNLGQTSVDASNLVLDQGSDREEESGEGEAAATDVVMELWSDELVGMAVADDGNSPHDELFDVDGQSYAEAVDQLMDALGELAL